MGIKGIDNLKPNENNIELYPEWPNVRCTNCGEVYVVENTARLLIEGGCPNCHEPRFLTQMRGANER